MNEEEFKEWLRSEVDTLTPISSYPNALKNLIPNELNNIREGLYNNLFDCEDIGYLKNLYTRLLQNGDLYEFNRRTKNQVSSASIQKYIKFLKYKLIKKQMELYDNKSYDFELNNATIFFQIDKNPNKYPVKALLKSIYQELDLPEDYRTNGAKSKLEQIFKYFGIKFIDNTKQEKNLNNKINIKNIILYGPPGIGKTHNYKRLISLIETKQKSEKEIFKIITNNGDTKEDEVLNFPNERVKFITFHQSYSYEDFIEGFRPQEDRTIKLEDGIFKIICDEASKNKEQNYYLVIDEINRGNISKIFGELITLIEEDKRDNLEVVLPYSKKPFKIPSNLYIIATMNSTDKSIATVDIALRRRFTFIKMKPNKNLVNYLSAKVFMQKLNSYTKDSLGEDYLIGHSYFMNIQNEDDFEFVKEYKIKPLLEEYFYAYDKSADDILEDIEKQGEIK